MDLAITAVRLTGQLAPQAESRVIRFDSSLLTSLLSGWLARLTPIKRLISGSISTALRLAGLSAVAGAALGAAGLGWWVWLERDSAPADWQALRVALVAWREAQRRPGRQDA